MDRFLLGQQGRFDSFLVWNGNLVAKGFVHENASFERTRAVVVLVVFAVGGGERKGPREIWFHNITKDKASRRVGTNQLFSSGLLGAFFGDDVERLGGGVGTNQLSSG